MRKLLLCLTAGLLLTGTAAFASPAVSFEKGDTFWEIGSTLNSKVSGRGHANADVDGKSGFKSVLTYGASDKFALQYKHGHFKSETATIMGITTYAEDRLQDLNLIYKLAPNLSLLAGYEHGDIMYGKYVEKASLSAAHFGLVAERSLDDKNSLFANVIFGNGVSLKEAGFSRKLSGAATLNISYAQRELRHVPLKINIPGHVVDSQENYTMSGITFIFAFKL
ncbi:MAG: hypothetical protein N2491_02365 [Negativicutes bacterium]|nr:hypothetical protein [Negativicutes bacterium]